MSALMCGICTENYGGTIVPILMMCCGNHACFDCAEKDKVLKIANLARNRKKIKCMHCNQSFHCKNDTPWQINRQFIEAVGIEVDTKAMREAQSIIRGIPALKDEIPISDATSDLEVHKPNKQAVAPSKLSQMTEINMDEVEWASEDPAHPSPPEYAYKPKSSKIEDPCGCVSKRSKRKGTSDSPTMLCIDNSCVLFACMEECRSNCKAGDLCGNKRITKKQWRKLQVVKAESNRKGVITLEDVKDGDFLIEYTGVAINKKYVDGLFQKYGVGCMINVMALDKNTYIDATRKGSIARHINHSSEPNCAVYRWKVEGVPRVGIFAITDIEAGTELFFDYNS